MIDQSNLKLKDFSIDLPKIATKLMAVSESLISLSFDPLDSLNPYIERTLRGFGELVAEIVCDIDIIDKALYWEDEGDDKAEEVKRAFTEIEGRAARILKEAEAGEGV